MRFEGSQFWDKAWLKDSQAFLLWLSLRQPGQKLKISPVAQRADGFYIVALPKEFPKEFLKTSTW